MSVFYLNNIKHFDPNKTFDCGQCFRFDYDKDGYSGVFRDMILKIKKNNETIIIETSKDISKDYFENTIVPYLDLDENYDEINADIVKYFDSDNHVIFKAMDVSDGIRILRQDYFETLISFIISQNNNIPRIKKIIQSLSMKFGNPFEYNGKLYYTFPSPESLYNCDIEELRQCGCGFRDRYIKSACEYYLQGKISYDYLIKQDYNTQLSTLMQVCGIGRKVADCIILYSIHNLKAFPIDVWIKRVIEKYYGTSLDINNLGSYPGVAQQYLFYYERYKKGE